MRRLVFLVPLFASFAFAGGDDTNRIWNGVFTASQAQRGKTDYEKNCSNCHNSDMAGSVRAPSVRGERFMQTWQNNGLDVLFVKLRDSMPATYPDAVTEEVKIDILAYLLQQNGFPAGPQELKLDPQELADIQIAQKGDQAAANFTLVRVAGCLTPVPGKAWTLTQATEPLITRDETGSAAALKAAAEAPLGAQTFVLTSIAAFKPDEHKGQKVEARGLVYRDANRNLLNVTSLASAGSGCH